MAVRWRKNGALICAAMSEPEEGDTYIDDRLHYQLSVLSDALVASPTHKDDGLWYWKKEALRMQIATGTQEEAMTAFEKLTEIHMAEEGG